MPTTTEFLTSDHRACDDSWAAVEAAAHHGDAAAAGERFGAFRAAMLRHLDFEEKRLFPALEQATGMVGFGPTVVMRAEHDQMRRLLDQMASAASRGATDDLLDYGDTLLMLIQQHNAKEEAMLYPMADARLGGRWSDFAADWPG